MKSIRGLWSAITDWSNLLLAARKAKRGKAACPNVQRFQYDLEDELLGIQDSLLDGSYVPGGFRSFTVFDPKRRLISAAPYRDRVVHHAICNVVEPVFDRSFIADSYANRRGKGTSAAVQRVRKLAARFPYVLKADIALFFPSIDHGILLQRLQRKLRDQPLRNLLARIVEHPFPGRQSGQFVFPGDDLFTRIERRVGLPIGNQTSQFFGNVYLDPMDHFIKETLRCRGYVRYMDDFLLFAGHSSQLREFWQGIADFLVSLRLKLHPRKTQMTPVADGFPFLGYRMAAKHLIRVRRANVTRFRRRMRQLDRQYRQGTISVEAIRNSILGWWGYAGQAAPSSFVRKIIADFSFFQELMNA